MSRYRRAATPNASYFFTVVAYRRQPILCDQVIRNALRAAIETVRATRPFVIEAWVLAMDDAVWDHSTISKNPDWLLDHEVVEAFFTEVMTLADQQSLLSKEHC